ncbi:hypothetical protein RR21198_4853 [Rhodococcus rhodochrous ATCC 21198]|uniref:hypothetical protein n=1 Tax=Rhodococcus aetherivorans TaxID=191292 RepID=UPI0003E23102|nr:hypothetical protein [Rhodococcus aetherivorans]ETT24257.1 hypothetical protein RR21198_4853 [Rhodococcus rhodochrous ATCC 21198]MDV6295215.1 hypothetical protein [Rhodococcus aetherivorans]NGP28031.1 hypothetical protein [Rhodococcus aetherivorans]
MSELETKATPIKLAGLPLVRQKSERDSITWYFQMDGQVDGYDKLRISLHYTKGGTNWATGDINPRGYYVSLQPVSLAETPWGVSESCTLFDTRSGKVKLEEANRFSAAKILTLQAKALEEIEPYARAVALEAAGVAA